MVETPYRILISSDHTKSRQSGYNIEDMDINLNSYMGVQQREVRLNKDGKVLVKIFKTGVMLTVKPPSGEGIPVDIHTVLNKIEKVGIIDFNRALVEKTVKQKTGKEVKIAEWTPNPDADSTLSVEVSPDEMIAYVNVSAPKVGGRHLQVEEIVDSLKHFGVVHGHQNDIIQEALDMERYGRSIPAAKGNVAKDGENGYVDYKVRTNKKVKFEEDEQGRVDFLAKDIIENVTHGQLLAVLVPGKKGIVGKTVTGKHHTCKRREKYFPKAWQGHHTLSGQKPFNS